MHSSLTRGSTSVVAITRLFGFWMQVRPVNLPWMLCCRAHLSPVEGIPWFMAINVRKDDILNPISCMLSIYYCHVDEGAMPPINHLLGSQATLSGKTWYPCNSFFTSNYQWARQYISLSAHFSTLCFNFDNIFHCQHIFIHYVSIFLSPVKLESKFLAIQQWPISSINKGIGHWYSRKVWWLISP